MTHIYGLSNANLAQPSFVTIGVFDGVHKGHQHLIRQLVDEAHSAGHLAVVATFFPHPDQVVLGIEGRYYLTAAEERAQYLLELGVDHVVTHPFNEETRMMRAATFVDLLVENLQMKQLWVGSDFALGYQREGDVEFLTKQGIAKGFDVTIIDLLQAGNTHVAISSTLIRDALGQGDVEKVREWLGRGYAVSGKVVAGKKRGRTIGFPTANIETWSQQLVPAIGVYAGWVQIGDERFMAVTNIGTRPTFNNNSVITIEAHLLDFERDIYDETISVSFEKYIRPEMKFDDFQALIEQIAKDVETGREFLQGIKAVSP
jgi:riboflavin kinase / FMN adenylyltransferase